MKGGRRGAHFAPRRSALAMFTVALLATTAAGCAGSQPAAPSSPAAVLQPPGLLQAGAYKLVLATSPSPSGFSTCISISMGGSSAGPLQTHMAAAVPALVELTATGWSGRSTEGTLIFTLRASSGGELSGTMSGVGKSESEGLSVEVGHTGASGVSLTGRQTSDVSAGGDVAGEVAFKSSISSLSCNGNTWSLVRR